VIVRVTLHFTVDRSVPPPSETLHDALEALRALEIEASSVEQAELYADLIRVALERAGS